MAVFVNGTVDFLFLSVLLTLVLYFYVTRKFRYWKNKGVAYLKPVPFLGNFSDVFLFKTSIGEFLGDVYHKSKQAFVGIWVFDEPCMVIRDPEVIKSILIKDFGSFNDRVVADNKKDDPMGSHILFVIKNPDWRAFRLKLTQVFTSGKMKNMFLLMNDVAEELKSYMEKVVNKNNILEAREVCGKFSTEVISSCAFGINANCFQNEDAEFRVVARRIFNWNSFIRGVSMTCYFVAPNLVRLFKMKFLDPFSVTFLRKAFWDTIDEREKTQHVRNDLIDMLLKIRKEEKLDDMYKLESDKLVAQAAQFFIAGFETTSSTISYTLYELAKYPQIQEKLRNEVHSVLEKYKYKMTYECLKEMTYLEMCVQETLRMYPVLPFLDRRCNTNYRIPGTEIILEKGTPVFIPVYGLHFDPQYYPEPEKYNPERFTEENKSTRSPFTYLPFGDGPRNCIGARFGTLSSKLGVATIVANYRIEMCENTPLKLKFDPKGFLLGPVNGVPLKFVKI